VERESLHTQLRQAQKMEAIGTLAGGIAHDFNNILSPIMLHAEMLMMDLPEDSPVQTNLKQIYRCGERARDLVGQILAFARKNEEDRIPLKASLIVKECLKLLRSTVPNTIAIHWDLKTERDTVLADPTQLNQIVMNLCINATHAMEDAGGLIEIVLENDAVDIEALEAFRDHPQDVDLVITDMTMPNMTGKELTRQLMAVRPDIPVVLCTGFSEKIDERRAKEIGIRAFVMKPIVMSRIAKTIREVLDGQ